MNLEELGARLRDRRMEQGLSIEDIAGRLKVPPRVLRAIEEGNKAELPHAVYVRSFVKSSGLMLGVPAEELAEMLASLSESSIVPTPIKSKGIMESQEDGNRGNMIMLAVKVLVVLLIIAGAYLVYTRNFAGKLPSSVSFDSGSASQSVEINKSESVAPSAAQSDNPWGEPAAAPVSGDAAVTQPTTAEELPAEKTESEEAIQADSESLAAALAAENATQEKKEKKEEKVAGIDEKWQIRSPKGSRHQLIVTAREDCWFALHADKDALERQRVLPAGKKMLVEFQNNATLRLGNPGGVDISFDGKPEKFDRKGVNTLKFPR